MNCVSLLKPRDEQAKNVSYKRHTAFIPKSDLPPPPPQITLVLHKITYFIAVFLLTLSTQTKESEDRNRWRRKCRNNEESCVILVLVGNVTADLDRAQALKLKVGE